MRPHAFSETKIDTAINYAPLTLMKNVGEKKWLEVLTALHCC